MIIDELAIYLENQEYGEKGTDIFIDTFPETATNCIVIYTTGGFPPRVDINHDETTYQFMVRNSSYSTGQTKINNIKNEFHNKTLTLDTSTVYGKATSDIGYLGKDEGNYHRFVINFSFKHRRSS